MPPANNVRIEYGEGAAENLAGSDARAGSARDAGVRMTQGERSG